MKDVAYSLMLEKQQERRMEEIAGLLKTNSVEIAVSARGSLTGVTAAGGDTVREILERTSIDGEIKAVHFGGPVGVILPTARLDTKIEDLDGTLYSLEMTVLFQDTCIVDYLQRLLMLCNEESCGRCVLCREGIRQMLALIAPMRSGSARTEDIEVLRQVAEVIADGSYCKFGKGVGMLVLSALRNFQEEFEDHAQRKRCPALVCEKYVTYHIMGNCSGCGECLEACEEEAIAGKKRFIHVISQIDCTRCGECANVCPENAVIRASGIKPRTPPRPVPCGSWKA